ncbi:unnamed protein product [Gongylonema pulchrum]|uniref:I/LWEQ domain-containing protein n=1 Tax=Gongylonema pulchrum TaxID=637853 RepID=A0A183E4N4_9BILA|nr:unnamed protein product [Gongylonema pulchrum]
MAIKGSAEEDAAQAADMLFAVTSALQDFALDTTEALISYATKMAIKGSAEEDAAQAADMLFAVTSALQVASMYNIDSKLHSSAK